MQPGPTEMRPDLSSHAECCKTCFHSSALLNPVCWPPITLSPPATSLFLADLHGLFVFEEEDDPSPHFHG